jgi:hypothetical protein
MRFATALQLLGLGLIVGAFALIYLPLGVLAAGAAVLAYGVVRELEGGDDDGSSASDYPRG